MWQHSTGVNNSLTVFVTYCCVIHYSETYQVKTAFIVSLFHGRNLGVDQPSGSGSGSLSEAALNASQGCHHLKTQMRGDLLLSCMSTGRSQEIHCQAHSRGSQKVLTLCHLCCPMTWQMVSSRVKQSETQHKGEKGCPRWKPQSFYNLTLEMIPHCSALFHS